MKKENPTPIPRTCECGTPMQKCEFFLGMSAGASICVPNGYNFPKTYSANAYFCEKCGKIAFYAESIGGEEKA